MEILRFFLKRHLLGYSGDGTPYLSGGQYYDEVYQSFVLLIFTMPHVIFRFQGKKMLINKITCEFYFFFFF